jgi:hypothetical protein
MLLTMLHRNANNTAPSLETRRNRTDNEDRDALLEEKDRVIAELKEQVVFLRGRLKSKDAILARMARGMVEPPSPSEAPGDPWVSAPRGVQNGSRPADAQQGREKPERATLPDGYRVVAVASDAWVLVAPRGLRVAGYRGELDLRKAALDAHEHHRRDR